jgi:hypothetical protein
MICLLAQSLLAAMLQQERRIHYRVYLLSNVLNETEHLAIDCLF